MFPVLPDAPLWPLDPVSPVTPEAPLAPVRPDAPEAPVGPAAIVLWETLLSCVAACLVAVGKTACRATSDRVSAL